MIRSTVVGSWPAEDRYQAGLQQYFQGELAPEEAEKLLSAAAGEAIRQQRDCGLVEYTGGETSADSFILHFPRVFTGLELIDPTAWYSRGAYQIVGEVSAPDGLGIANAFRRERKIDPGIPKVTIPGPSEISMMIEPEADRRKIWPKLTGLIRDEIHACIQAGAADIQLDLPHAAMALADRHASWNEDLVVELIRDIFADVSAVRRSVHFCYGDFGAQSWTDNRAFQPLLPVIQRLDGIVDRVVLEFSLPEQWADRHLLAEIPSSLEVAVGIIDVKSPTLETVPQIQNRINELIRFIPAERLLICPSCGFGRREVNLAVAKTTLMVQASNEWSSAG